MTRAADRRHLLIFARDPTPGQVKTRLIPAMGVASATAVYRRMLFDTLRTASGVNADRRELWIDRPDPTPELLTQADIHGMSVHIQAGPDLGARMHTAFAETLSTGQRAVLIGTDCPEYDVHYLESAFQALELYDAVIGPARDGGYVLIGLKASQAGLFRDIPWGSGDVLSATRTRMLHLQLSWSELPPRHDVDEPADVQRFPHLISITGSLPPAGSQE